MFSEFTFNLESFNPAFTAVIFQVQNSIGASDYERRDQALKRLVLPLAGEYGMHNGEEQGAPPLSLLGLLCHIAYVPAQCACFVAITAWLL